MEYSTEGLPIIDLESAIDGDSKSSLADLAKHVANACEATGCFYIKNHGVNQDLIKNFFRDLRVFFAQPLDYKMKYQVDFSLDRGYFPFESQNVNAFMGRQNLPNDPVEKLAVGPSKCKYPVAENLWPDIPATLKENGENYYESIRKLSTTLMRIFALAVNAPNEEYFYRNCCHAPNIMKANFYPSYSSPKPMQSTRFAPHTDITPFTILATDSCPNALQVKNAQGEWIFANPVPGTLFVNLGEVLQRWTNDQWKATEHSVVWPQDGSMPDRLSIVYFVGMHPDAMIECVPSCIPQGEKAKYEPIMNQEFLNRPMRGLSLKY